VSESLTPTEGARFLLERIEEVAGGAKYRATIFTPEATYAGTAELREDGSAAVTIGGASAELVEVMQMLTKLTARSAAKKREDGFPPWPARVLRWRGPGRG
jgi:hypothetical protein